MGLSEDQKKAMTLGEFEELAARFGAALSVFKEAQALLGAQATPAAPTAPVARPPTRFNDPDAEAELRAVQARREAARANPAEYPPAIAASMRGQ